jgi:hypothetical protein
LPVREKIPWIKITKNITAKTPQNNYKISAKNQIKPLDKSRINDHNIIIKTLRLTGANVIQAQAKPGIPGSEFLF